LIRLWKVFYDMLNRDIGFKKENVLLVKIPETFSGSLAVYKKELLEYSEVSGVSIVIGIPNGELTNLGFERFENKENITINLISA